MKKKNVVYTQPMFTGVYAVATFGCQGATTYTILVKLKQGSHQKRVLVVKPEHGTNSL